MKSNRIMILFIIISAFSIIFTTAVSRAHESEDGSNEYDYSTSGGHSEGVNSMKWGLILQVSGASGGTGYSFDGTGYPIDEATKRGASPGKGFSLDAMVNFSFFSLKVDYTYSTINNMEWDTGDDSSIIPQPSFGPENDVIKYEIHGNGSYRTFDVLPGLKLFTEPGDMGYTNFYFGYRQWGVKLNVDEVFSNGIPYGSPYTPYKHELRGRGWIAGYRDLSTFPQGLFAYVFESAVYYYKAPITSMKVNGISWNCDKQNTYGIGLDLGAGLAFENTGLLILLGCKLDFLDLDFYSSSSRHYNSGAHYVMFYISVEKEF